LEFEVLTEPAQLLQASPLMRRSMAIALLGAAQFGWLMSEMAHLPFNNKQLCAAPRTPAGQCLLYPGHSNAEWNMQSSAWAVGGGLGALLSAYPADKFGRKRTLGYNGIVMIVGALVQMLAGDIYSFAIGRGISGVASGVAINVLNNYIREIAPRQWRMFYFNIVQVVIGFTALCVTSIMYGIPKLPESDWSFKPLFGGPIFLGLFQLVFMNAIIESPVWLLQQNQVDAARSAMDALYKAGDIDDHFASVAASVGRQMDETKSSSSKMALLLSPKYRQQLSIALVLGTMQQLSGLNALIVYGPTIFKNIGVRDLRLVNTFVNYGRTHNMILAMAFGDRFHRRTLLVGASIVMSLAALGFTLCQVYPNDTTKYIIVVCTLFFVSSYSFSVGSMGWLISTELVPESLGATSGALATACTWTAQFFVGVYFQQLSSVDNWGTQAFAVFAVLIVTFALFAYYVVPETRNSTSDEITALFTQSFDDAKVILGNDVYPVMETPRAKP
ncbi:hypothetical protein As57867_003416, partial [Aphanomyces stellatus]